MKNRMILFLTLAVFITLIYFFFNKTETQSTKKMETLLMATQKYDTTINGKKVSLFTLKNKGGIVVQCTNYGAHLVSIITPDKAGNYADILLGYNSIEGYLNDKIFSACVVGPFANRIAKGKFIIDDMTYTLLINDGENHLHSGPDGFHKEIYDAVQEGNKVTMTLSVPDMKTGFPGNKLVTVIYELLPDNRFRMKLQMRSDKKTLANLTNHAYWNLSGEGSESILEHLIQIHADSMTPVYKDLIPTGEILSVENTPFDLRSMTPVGKMINDTSNIQIRFGGGYDHNFVLSKETGTLGKAAHVIDPVSRRSLEVYTNQPGIQFYSSNFMDGSATGKSGKPYKYRSALALEPQKYPDSPNHINFPSPILEPGQVYEHIIEYVFGVEE
jgi:aldose 1-epimerase